MKVGIRYQIKDDQNIKAGVEAINWESFELFQAISVQSKPHLMSTYVSDALT